MHALIRSLCNNMQMNRKHYLSPPHRSIWNHLRMCEHFTLVIILSPLHVDVCNALYINRKLATNEQLNEFPSMGVMNVGQSWVNMKVINDSWLEKKICCNSMAQVNLLHFNYIDLLFPKQLVLCLHDSTLTTSLQCIIAITLIVRWNMNSYYARRSIE